MTQTGWRKPTPALARANALADAGEATGVVRARAIISVKRVAAAIGLKAGDLVLLDTLVAFTRQEDWEEGARPVAWPSNALLMEQTGLSLSALKRRSRHLCALGLIAYRDSPNGKRYGHRDAQGRIVEAYGFDLSPLCARTAEFEALHVQLCEERALMARMRRRITIARRTVAAILDTAFSAGLGGAWKAICGRLQDLLARLPGRREGVEAVAASCEALEALVCEAEKAFRTATARASKPAPEIKSMAKMNPREAENGPHIPVTTESGIVERNGRDEENAGRTAADIRPAVESDRKAVPQGAHRAQAWREPAGEAPGRAGEGAARPAAPVELATVMAACPAFTDMAHGVSGHVGDWHALVGVAAKVRPMIGISADAWEAAQRSLGAEVAAAALALITDKYSAGDVTSPGGYLRGLVAKAARGDLHLARSFHGRLGQAGARR